MFIHSKDKWTLLSGNRPTKDELEVYEHAITPEGKVFIHSKDKWTWISGNHPTKDELEAYERAITPEMRRNLRHDFIVDVSFLWVVMTILVFVAFCFVPIFQLRATACCGFLLIATLGTIEQYYAFRKDVHYARLYEQLQDAGRIHDPEQSLLRYVLQQEGDANKTRLLLDKFPQDVDDFVTNYELQFTHSQLGPEADPYLLQAGNALVRKLLALEQAAVEPGKQAAREILERYIEEE